MKIYLETTSSNAIVPKYACSGDAGMDVYSAEDYLLAPGETHIFKTNLKLAIPEGYEIQVRPRSGVSAKTLLRVANAPGTVDSGYRGDVGVILTNISRDYIWNNNTIVPMSSDIDNNTLDISGKNISKPESNSKHGYYKINKGDRIAQIVLCKYENIEFEAVESVENIGINRGGGFGHTGTK